MANLSKAVCHGDQINADSGIRRRSQTFRDLVLGGVGFNGADADAKRMWITCSSSFPTLPTK
jgi:hypothetical protein